LVGSAAPSVFDPWLNAYARDPGHFLIAAAVVAGLMLLGAGIGAKITDEMRGIWKSAVPVDRGGFLDRLIYGLRTSAPYQWVLWATKRHVAPFIFAVLFVYLGVTFASHLLFNVQDAAGWVCQERQVEYQRDARHPNRVSVKDYKGLVNLPWQDARGARIQNERAVSKHGSLARAQWKISCHVRQHGQLQRRPLHRRIGRLLFHAPHRDRRAAGGRLPRRSPAWAAPRADRGSSAAAGIDSPLV
jgi:hypothetical protein